MRGTDILQNAVTTTGMPNVDAIPAGPDLESVEDHLDRLGVDPLAAMMPVIKTLKPHYDYILINASSDRSNVLNFSSLVASDYSVLVTPPRAPQRLQELAEEVHDIVCHNNPQLRPLGILINNADEAARESLRNDAHAADMSLFETVLPPGNLGQTSASYKNLANEILRKITHPEN
jgi:cellulose biosynthesis protein BcsQ